MWRTVIISQGEKIIVRDKWLIVFSDTDESSIPLKDIYSVVIDNRQTLISINAITGLSEAGVHIIFCNNKHLPISLLLTYNTHYRPLNVIKSQFELTREFKDILWQKIIRAKINNQCTVLKLCNVPTENQEALSSLIETITPGDKRNCEAIAAKRYFKALFGTDFMRFQDDVTNAALNYGYTIIRSCLAKTLVCYGYNCVLGIHHIGANNPFNLADDLIEPLRPLVDYWVDNHCNELVDTLTKSNRRELINLVNHVIAIEGKKMRVRYAIDYYVNGLTTAISKQDATLLRIPEIIKPDVFFEDEQDG